MYSEYAFQNYLLKKEAVILLHYLYTSFVYAKYSV